MHRHLLFVALLTGCGTHVYRPGPGLEVDDPRQIDDEAIRRALEAGPQMVLPARVGLFSFDEDRTESLLTAMSEVPGVAGSYGIPRVMVDGRRRFTDPWQVSHSNEPLSMPQLRLLAARAGCDLLAVADYGWRRTTGANGLAALNVLLLPTLLSPFMSVELESYLDTHVIDVRDGYLYGRVSASLKTERPYVTIYGVEDDAPIEDHWETLLAETRGELAALLTDAPG